MTVIDTAALPWEERWNEHLGETLYRKNLIEDPETGAEIRVVRYPKGVINTQQMLCANQAMIEYFMPFLIEEPPVLTAESDVTVLFITNRKFDIQYLP